MYILGPKNQEKIRKELMVIDSNLVNSKDSVKNSNEKGKDRSIIRRIGKSLSETFNMVLSATKDKRPHINPDEEQGNEVEDDKGKDGDKVGNPGKSNLWRKGTIVERISRKPKVNVASLLRMKMQPRAWSNAWRQELYGRSNQRIRPDK